MKQNVRYKAMCRHITRSMLVLLLSFVFLNSFGQGRTVSGVITDENGASMPGVNVVVKGTTTGTVTDLDGKFTINVPGNETILAFSFIGYTGQEIQVGEQTTINVVMKEEVKKLDEVVVIGYGVQKKSDLTGAVASVKGEELTKIPVSSVDAALQGKAAGVQVAQNTGAPGSATYVRVRGVSTITAVNGQNQGQPTWIVDGVPAGANSVNVSDIESIEILKDASSAAIYGSNGANGVILITTKQGKPGKTSANINYYHGFQYVPNRINVASGPEFGAMYTELQALKTYNSATAQFDTIDKKPGKKVQFPNYKSLPTYNYQDLIFRTALIDNLDFNVSGGNEKHTSYFGAGYNNQEGILKSSNYEKLNIRIKNDYIITNWFKVGENAAFTQEKTFGWDEWQYQSEYASPITSALTRQPNLPPYDSVGNWVPRDIGNTDDPMNAIDLMHHETRNYSGNATFYGIIEPIKGLSFQSQINRSISFGDSYTFSPTYYYGSSLGQYNYISSIYRSMNKYLGYNWQNIITYNKTLLNDINLCVVAGYEVGRSESMDMNGTRQYLMTEAPEMWYFNASTDDTTRSQIVKGGGSESAGYSYLGRINLDYKGKYLAQFNFRRDYSSKFGPNNRVGNFPGISVGWKFSEEDFIKNNLNFISFGKLRFGYGTAGNNAIKDYSYYTTVRTLTTFGYPFYNTTGESTGAGPDVMPNLSVHWEQIVTQNYGTDLAFFNNKLSVTVERFLRYNKGMLIPTTIPGYAGWTVRDLYQESQNVDPRPVQNVGKITNKGWEFSINWKDKLGDLRYSVGLNYTYVRNIATDLGVDSVRWGGGFLSFNNICRTLTGHDIGDFYGYKVEKIFGPNDKMGYTKIGKNYVPVVVDQPYTTKPNAKDPTITDTTYAQNYAQHGDFKIADLNHDGKITDADRTVLGNPFPRHLLGIDINLQFGWFDLSMSWQGTFGNKIFNAAKYYQVNQSGLYNWSSDYVNNHYRDIDIVALSKNGVIATFPANTNAKYPRLDPNNKNGNFDYISSFYVEDGSYMRLRNVQLGLTLPSKWTSKLAISEFRLYVGAKNLLTFTKYSGMDPEITQQDPLAAGIDKAAYPQARSFTFGATVKF